MSGRTHRQLTLLAVLAGSTVRLLSTDVDLIGSHFAVAAGRMLGAGVFALAALLGGAVPDLDLWLQRQRWVGPHCPHRGPTHSLIGIAVIGWPLAATFGRIGLSTSGDAVLWGWSFHILLDLLTPQGVAVAWPWRRRFRLLPLARAVRTQHERRLCRLALIVVLLLPLLVIGP